jgi:hypothetical protein
VATVVLYSGDRELGEKLWPAVEQTLAWMRHGQKKAASTSPSTCPTAAQGEPGPCLELWRMLALERSAELARFIGKGDQGIQLDRNAQAARQAYKRACASEPASVKDSCMRVWAETGSISERLAERFFEVRPDQADQLAGGTRAWAGSVLPVVLFGLKPVADGLEVNPWLPAGWSEISLSAIPFRGKTLTIVVRQGNRPTVLLNSKPWREMLIRDKELISGENRLEITVVSAGTSKTE